jgi:glycogen debranching enzyme
MAFTAAALLFLAALLLTTGVGAPLGIVLIVVAFGVLAWQRNRDPVLGAAAVRRRLHVATQGDARESPPPSQPRPSTPLGSRHQQDKHKVTTPAASSFSDSIADAVPVKDGGVFMMTDVGGSIPFDGAHGLGLYYRDCRYLSGCELRLEGTAPEVLGSTAHAGFAATHLLTNRRIRTGDGRTIPPKTIDITWDQVADADHLAIHHVIRFDNRSLHAHTVEVRFRFRAAFEDIFVVRQVLPPPDGNASERHWESDGRLTFARLGEDGVRRSLAIRFARPPDAHRDDLADVHVRLPSRGSYEIRFSVSLREGQQLDVPPPDPAAHVLARHQATRHRASDEARAGFTGVSSDSILLTSTLDRSIRDLHVLEMSLEGEAFFAAGLPWFATLFGRDTLITALEMLAFSPDVAEQTLRLMARYQGTRVDEWREEQPGKILHELRVGEMARAGRIPHTPYYGSVDSTPLFLILLERHAAWTGRLDLFEALRENVDRALAWIDRYGDADGDGYVEYRSDSGTAGLANQGWKDSGDSIVNEDGSLADPPIALVEVQAYVYAAKRGLADLFRRARDRERAARLTQEADSLRARFNRDYWLEDKSFYALARQSGGRPCAVVASNPGHALWAGIADAHKGEAVARRLMQDDMWSGWGIRTLSSGEARYNPVGYHLGTVWPHDNAMIAAGLRRHGRSDAAMRIFVGLLEAAAHFEHRRLPEVFTGVSRAHFSSPIPYPVACHPQAWASGAVPYVLTTMLGLEAQGFDNRLEIHAPELPPFVDRLELTGLRVGQSTADLLFHRVDSVCRVEVPHCAGGLEVVLAEQPELAVTRG